MCAVNIDWDRDQMRILRGGNEGEVKVSGSKRFGINESNCIRKMLRINNEEIEIMRMHLQRGNRVWIDECYLLIWWDWVECIAQGIGNGINCLILVLNLSNLYSYLLKRLLCCPADETRTGTAVNKVK